jgi:hypothetical protein
MNTPHRWWAHLAGVLLYCLPTLAWPQSPVIQEIINSVNLDSLAYTVKVLSGEIGSTSGGQRDTILTRAPRMPGRGGSDQDPFLRQKYHAMALLEGHWSISPGNHTSSDRIGQFNLDYFYRQAQLAVATTAFLAGMSPPSTVSETRSVATTFSLEQNYPNPFNPSTTIRYTLPHRSFLTLTVFNTLGQAVGQLVRGELDAGHYEAKSDAGDLASEVYFYRLRAGEFVQTKKLVLLH